METTISRVGGPLLKLCSVALQGLSIGFKGKKSKSNCLSDLVVSQNKDRPPEWYP